MNEPNDYSDRQRIDTIADTASTFPEETYETGDAVCPWCQATQSDTWEHFTGHDPSVDTDCDTCGRPISITENVSTTYATKPRGVE